MIRRTQTLAYYCGLLGLLGLREAWRPELGFAGAGLYAGEQAVRHIYWDRPQPPTPTGVIDRMACSRAS